MTRPLFAIVLFGMLYALLPSCQAVSKLVHDGEVVAHYCDSKLYRWEVESVIPMGLSSEDSASFAKQYIESWARDKAFMDLAQRSLSKEEMDLSKELQAYTEALLKYRYEQHYVNERLDTVVTDSQIEECFESNKETFRLPRPILKARFIRTESDSDSYRKIRKLMSSDKVEDVLAADSIAFHSARHYHDFSGIWVDASSLAAEFETDYVTMLSCKVGPNIEMTSQDGSVSYAYVTDFVRAGEIPPVEYCEDKIKEMIVSQRKRDLLQTLERDLLDDARAKSKFEIYSE